MVFMGHDEVPYRVPHYSNYTVRGVPQLEELENELCKLGLKDPWIRNEAWRFHKGWGTKLGRARNAFVRGIGVGFVLTLATIAFDKVTGRKDDHHGGEHH